MRLDKRIRRGLGTAHRRTVLALFGVTATVVTLSAAAPASARDTVRDKPRATTRHKPRATAPKKSRDPFDSPSLRTYLAHRSGDVSAAAYDVDTGATYLYRPQVREQTASIVKVDILATLLHQAQRRGRGLTAAEKALAQPMIEMSDNGDASALWNQEGGANAVSAFDREVGMDETTPNAAGYWGLTWTTASDQLALLRRVMLPNRLLDLGSRKYEYELMRHVVASQDWGVSAGLAQRAAVALKNGWLPLPSGDWQVNSIGSIVGSGRKYLIAVLTRKDPTEDYGISTIEQISAATWQALRKPAPHRQRRVKR